MQSLSFQATTNKNKDLSLSLIPAGTKLFTEENMFKTVLFDLDDTIFDFKKSERAALIKTFNELGIEPDEMLLNRYSIINQQWWKRLERREITRHEVKVGRYRELFDEFGIILSPEKATAVYEEMLCNGHYFVDGAEKMLDELYDSYDLYLVSNGAKRVQDSRLASAGISHYFKGIFISEEVGFEKPAPEFFDYCFKSMNNADKSNAVIIGDSLTSDIKGGINAGIKTVWFNPDKKANLTEIIPDYEIEDLLQIKEILEL